MLPAIKRDSRLIPKWTDVALVALGVASLVLYRGGLLLRGTDNMMSFLWLVAGQGAIYVAAAVIVWRARAARSTLVVVVVFAALFRLSILFAPPQLSDDIYRYIWDGRVQATGTNPYAYVPADDALAHLRDDEIYTKINRRDYAKTIYPPVAQMIYFAVTRVSESVTWMKAVMVGCEAVALWAVVQLLGSFGLARQRALLFAWHPLVVWEIAGSGHVDALMLAFVWLALLAHRRGRETLTGIALACATLVKFYPLALAPALYRRWGWRMPSALLATVGVAYLPYVSVGAEVFGFLPGYTAEEGIRDGNRFFLLNVLRKMPGLSDVPPTAFNVLALVVLAAVAAWAFVRPLRSERDYIGRALALAAAFTLLLSPPYSWYYAWLVPFLCFVSPRVWAPFFYLTLASFVLYYSWFGDKAELVFMLNAIIYAPFAVLGLVAVIWTLAARRRDGRDPSTELPEQEPV